MKIDRSPIRAEFKDVFAFAVEMGNPTYEYFLNPHPRGGIAIEIHLEIDFGGFSNFYVYQLRKDNKGYLYIFFDHHYPYSGNQSELGLIDVSIAGVKLGESARYLIDKILETVIEFGNENQAAEGKKRFQKAILEYIQSRR